jgi:hypothetical protein
MRLYKVVRKLKNGDLVSALIEKDTGMRETYRHHGVTQTVPVGFLFTDLNAAKEWAKDWVGHYSESSYEIWECEVKKTSPMEWFIHHDQVCKSIKEKLIRLVCGDKDAFASDKTDAHVYNVSPEFKGIIGHNVRLTTKLYSEVAY